MDKGPVTDGINVGYEVRTNGDDARYAKNTQSLIIMGSLFGHLVYGLV